MYNGYLYQFHEKKIYIFKEYFFSWNKNKIIIHYLFREIEGMLLGDDDDEEDDDGFELGSGSESDEDFSFDDLDDLGDEDEEASEDEEAGGDETSNSSSGEDVGGGVEDHVAEGGQEEEEDEDDQWEDIEMSEES